ncbi:hypothetical protein JX266_013540 [Neoarthrinium moseri]|nr:hypothetical protein JX266_013540 [Neoarthrinium moseri]
MVDGLSIASSIVALVAFAFESSTVLYKTIRDFQSQDKSARALKDELADLRGVLQSLTDTLDKNPSLNFDALKIPLLRCGKTCEEYGGLIARCTKHSNSSRPSIRDWINQQYLKGDITDFKEMLAGYKSTINIAIANANLLAVASITPNALEEYKDLIRDTKNDLQEHMTRLEERAKDLAAAAGGSESDISDNLQWLAMSEEKQSTQEGLKICSQLSAQILKFESTSREHPEFSQQPSAYKFIRSGLSGARGSIRSLALRLESHKSEIDETMRAMKSKVSLSDNEAVQLAQLQETRESLGQCMSVVADASESLSDERYNLFEDVTMAGKSYGITVSTMKDLVIARRLNLSDEARYVGGQLSDESYQRTIDGLTQLDLESAKLVGNAVRQAPQTDEPEGRVTSSGGFDRYGRGFNLSANKQQKK